MGGRCTSLALFLAFAAHGVASAQQRTQPTVLVALAPNAHEAPRASSPSRSIGVPDRGRLRDGVQLVATPHLFVREARRPATFGTAELVGLITRSAASVRASGTGPRLVVGDLSGQNGGRLSPHRSHRNGRDADIGFYVVDTAGQPIEPPHFVQIRRNGCGDVRGTTYCFDAARNWDLLVAMTSDPEARVQYVLVAPDLRRRLLDEGARRNAPADVIARVALATEPHSGSASHRSHFHLRVYCAVDDRPECIDEPPFHAWYEGEPAPRSPSLSARRSRERAIRARQAARIRARARRRAAQRQR
jgi:penicillin-insensitive murein endopeptidase